MGEGGIGCDLDEVCGVGGLEFGVVGGEFVGDGFDFVECDGVFGRDELVDVVGECEGLFVVDDVVGDGDFEEGVVVFGGGLGLELVVLVGVKLGVLEVGGVVGGVVGVEGEFGEFINV